jgi:hypothetical protein
MRFGDHRRYTDNHTWHLDWKGRRLFLKANPNHEEARAEAEGHARLQNHYPAPALHARLRLPGWTFLIYDRWPHLASDNGLLLDVIAEAERTGDNTALDACLTDFIGHYRRIIDATAELAEGQVVIGKLYRDRATSGGRLDDYYGEDRPWLLGRIGDGSGLRPSELAGLDLVVNGRAHHVDFAAVLAELRSHFTRPEPVWSALTQGDPTDWNLGWSSESGPVWFDYDTAGRNAIAGEFACFLTYQRLHGPWLTPRYNPAAYTGRDGALQATKHVRHDLQVRSDTAGLRIDYEHQPSPARRHAMTRYLDELVRPIAASLDIEDVIGWLRPYLLMRLLGVFDLTFLEPEDAALSLALIAETLHPAPDIDELLALQAADEKATRT